MSIKLFTYKDIDRIASLPKDAQEPVLRQIREPLLKAWDILKTDIAYGIYTHIHGEKDRCLQWRQDILDLKFDAFREENIPECVKKYLS